MNPIIFRVSAACVALASCVFLRAQDVTVGAPAWFPGLTQTGPVPKWKFELTPGVPDEARGDPAPGYALIIRAHDGEGTGHQVGTLGTMEAYVRAANAVVPKWMQAPLPKGEKSKESIFWLPLIFNPESARKTGPEATPRLLSVTPIVVPKDLIVKGKPSRAAVRVEVAATGAVTGVTALEGTEPRLAEILEAAVKQWTFAPARTGGQPVAASVLVPVVYGPQPKVPQAGTLPVLVKKVEPIYPRGQVRNGLNGEVEVEFEVDVTGKTQKITVLRTNNPAFSQPVIDAVSKWVFKPGTKDGKPAATKMRQKMRFGIEDNGGRDAFEAEVPRDARNLPSELRVDVQPRIIGLVRSIYPHAALLERAHGEVEAVVRIDATGKVTAVKVTKAARPDFGLAYAAALECMAFEPAKKNGAPTPSLLVMKDEFTIDGMVDDDSRDLLRREQKKPESIVLPDKLDRPLKPTVRRAPVLPTALAQPVVGEATVEVLVDEKGMVRLPRVVSATEEALGHAAAQAVSRWQFEPPVVSGKPAVVRVRVPFRFKPQTPPTAPNAPAMDAAPTPAPTA